MKSRGFFYKKIFGFLAFYLFPTTEITKYLENPHQN